MLAKAVGLVFYGPSKLSITMKFVILVYQSPINFIDLNQLAAFYSFLLAKLALVCSTGFLMMTFDKSLHYQFSVVIRGAHKTLCPDYSQSVVYCLLSC